MAAALELPPGFRFHPTDEELVMHYLCRKCESQQIAVPIIAEIDLYKYDPWDLPGMALYGEKEWYFFSPRGRKYPNGSRPNRTAGSGYWKATGADKSIGQPKPVGIKKALVFYAGKAPKGQKTNWIMHEYRLADVDRSARKKNSLRLDDWVLCRIYNKKGWIEQQQQQVNGGTKQKTIDPIEPMEGETKPVVMAPPSSATVTESNDYVYLETSDSVAPPSCSEQVVSPEIAWEVESERKWKELVENGTMDFPYNYMDVAMDMFMYMEKPF